MTMSLKLSGRLSDQELLNLSNNKYILNSKFTHEVADQLLKRRITSLLVALTHYSSGKILDIERIGSSNTYQADSPP